ncbi:MAG: type I restriction enzyme HsdR N-terminal domain-containing protein [Bacteroidales bacterium]|nr:type I restriction enzyme HsdR N-terminal domain-containing protein [Bacteroidales bacterium]MCF8458597.1 type I restriction enzyme HsdR N-terminal domain-containing protein [Bacteroidales bacterium]
MKKLNLPAFPFKIKEVNGKPYIFDNFRKKYVVLTPEEWVRQHFAIYMVVDLNYPKNLISMEHSLTVNNLSKRGDIVAFNRKGQAVFLIECKAPSVKIDQKTFDQIATYNMQLNVPLLAVTNGLDHYCCRVDSENKSYTFLENIPVFDSL